MNFLFTTVLVLLLVAPGLAFFRAYHAGKFSIRYSNLTISDQVFRSVIPGITVQLFVFWLIQCCSGYAVKLDVLGTLLLGAKEDQTVQASFRLLNKQLGFILSYHLCMISLGAGLGWFARWLVRRAKWDRRYDWLRYDNQWHYLLTGEILETHDLQNIKSLSKAARVDWVFVDILVKLEGNNTLYSGILAAYDLASDGGLRNIYLHAAERKQLVDANSPSSMAADAEPVVNTTYYPVAGDLMVIPYSQILNINFTYWIDEADADKEEYRFDDPDPKIDISLTT